MVVKRSVRVGVEDRWHRDPRRGEEVSWPADGIDGPVWCVDSKHTKTPGALVCTARHGIGKRWLSRWVDNKGREQSKSFVRRADAQKHAEGIATALNTGTYADPRRSTMTFATVAEEWFDGKRGALEPKTVAGNRSLLDVVVLPKWADTPLRDIQHPDIQDWVNWLRESPDARTRPARSHDDDDDEPKGLSAARVIHAFQVVDQVLNYAIRSRYIAVNPADGVHLPRKASRRDKALSHEQIRSLADAAGELSTVVYVLGYGGMRYGELAALRVNNVQVGRSRLWIARSITHVSGVGDREGPTKTHQERWVTLPRFVMDKVADTIRGHDESEFVFARQDGEAMPLDYFRWRFDKACAAAELVNVTPKTLRHTAGSLALAAGATIVTVSKLMGHKDVTTTMNIYAHELPDDFDNLASAMDSAARKAAGG
ncbi:tyrosine-type recombinase/integrase [Mycobacterium sp. 5-140-3-2]|uniref:tyrosine-type recombinase/integrase n=1 Tax=unclassified Mycobacterium TaxID=2642494 RepID=UPI002D786D49|nr:MULTISPECIES: tyrosine-type recombinase/integrase [unclassified Mycobacterium]WRU84193.1 tyrosine-type recombinase/integrase [Mycobacterium sp. 5-140-3-2]WSE39661.1 tyrosine-type recombinase/integrase [Mycobacterium sp. 5-140-3-1]